MASVTKAKRSGSRAPVHPKTKVQRLIRVQELTERIGSHLVKIDELGRERDRIVGELRDLDKATFKEIASATGKTEQAMHKSFTKRRRNGQA